MNPQEAANTALSTPTLLIICAAAIAVLLTLIIRIKLHPFFALVLVSIGTAIATGIDVSSLMDTLIGGFGKTLGNVALLIGFGAVLGRIVATSGGARVLSDTLIRACGRDRAPFGLSVAALLFCFPIFLDAAYVVMLPIIYAVARELKSSILLFGLPVGGAGLVMHALMPPHPGPVAAAVFLHADIGQVLFVGLLVGLPTWYVMGYRLSVFLANRTPYQRVPDMLGDAHTDDAEPPAFSTVLLVLLLPLLLIFMNTGLSTLISSGTLPEDNPLLDVLMLIGETPMALLISTLVAMWLLVLKRAQNGGMNAINDIVENAMAPVCSIILITGAGGMFGTVLTQSGIGTALAGSLNEIGMPLIVAGYVIASVIRIAQGSATVAGTTAAGIMAPAVLAAPELAGLPAACIVTAIVAGAIGYSHVNDSGFWLVGRFLGVSTRTMLTTWSVVSVGISLMAFGLAWLLFAFIA
ncbi:GntP family permease [Larsenimonas suaedae]|uniref:GntP family permease n=1 Tax=Larsenimonas suaedae TaxID=1851019 RepID=A0ABU1GS06_9GAMM|nr:GntP family permease [Larsenimonas suaedae]MCM2972393.1 GntP family permease [Larsenimonas suaedae]MDR5894811.1 GntP family permease [Larsenimonas suaedae]